MGTPNAKLKHNRTCNGCKANDASRICELGFKRLDEGGVSGFPIYNIPAEPCLKVKTTAQLVEAYNILSNNR